jgi:2-polyprenyl-3-methyl-5-hydroxy-6-metoxy-1,4-benzoquinol methylase
VARWEIRLGPNSCGAREVVGLGMTNTAHPQSSELVSAFWGDERKDLLKHNWHEHPTARQFINQRVSGDPTTSFMEYWRRRFVPEPVPLALSVGCGFGVFERSAAGTGVAQKFEAFDISASAIAQARVYAAEAGLGDRISYSVMDLNTEDLPSARYDAIFGVSSIHHLFALESVFRRCRDALKPGALLFLDDYIGPSRFQCSPRAVQTINRLLKALPSKYRLNVYLNGQTTDSYKNPSISWFEEHDPSEAVRSAEILPVLSYYFDIVDFRPYGGSILHMLLSGTAGNFDSNAENDVALLEIMAILEETLEEFGVLQADFASIVARPRHD